MGAHATFVRFLRLIWSWGDWYGRHQNGRIEALEDGKPRPVRIWKKISDDIATIVNVALEEPDLSPRSSMVFTPSEARWSRDEAVTMT